MADTQRPATQFAVPATAGTKPGVPRESAEALKAWFMKVVGELTRGRGATLHQAEDATMKAIEEMLRVVEPGAHSLAYVRTAAIHNFIKEQTRYGKKVPDRLDDPRTDQHAEGVTDHQVTQREGERWCEDILGNLPLRQREVMERVAAGLSNTEIAGDLGMSGDAVRRNKSDACKTLRKILLPDGEYRKPIAPGLVPGRGVRRAAEAAVAISASLAASRRDLRAMSPGQREETAAKAGELRELLLR